jgi:hypothetical protein
MESLANALAQIFANRIKLGADLWYCLDVDAQHLDGLSKPLNITPEAYHLLAIELGWVKPFKGRHGVSFPLQGKVVDAFFWPRTIPYEVSKTKIPLERKRYNFLRLGPFVDASFKPADQFDGRRLPRASIGGRPLDELKDIVRQLDGVPDDEDTEEDQVLTIGDVEDDAGGTAEREVLRNRLHNELDILVDALAPSDVSLFTKDDKRLEDVVQSLVFQRRSTQVRHVSIACGSKILQPNDDFDPNRFKVLQDLGAPIDCRYLAYIIQDILELEQVAKCSILSLVKAGNGRELPCIVIRKDPKKSRETLELVLDHSAMTPGSMAVQLLRLDESQVVEALKKEGLRIAKAAMPALMMQAMANAGAIGDTSLATVRRFCRFYHGMIMFASQDALRGISGSKGLESQCLTAMVEKKRTPYWIKDVRQVVLHELSSRSKFLTDIRTVDVIISGDHGKGFYRMIALILLWQSNTVIKPVRVPVEIASMRCRKDTVEVLEAIVPAIDVLLENLRGSRVLLGVNSQGVTCHCSAPMLWGEYSPQNLHGWGPCMNSRCSWQTKYGRTLVPLLSHQQRDSTSC